MMKAAKGNLVVYGRDHSYCQQGSGTFRYRDWHVGTVASASRDGIVKTIAPGTGCALQHKPDSPCYVASFDRVSAATAAALRERFAGTHWQTSDEAASAVKAALAFELKAWG